jgi:hypothetical protein
VVGEEVGAVEGVDDEWVARSMTNALMMKARSKRITTGIDGW